MELQNVGFPGEDMGCVVLFCDDESPLKDAHFDVGSTLLRPLPYFGSMSLSSSIPSLGDIFGLWESFPSSRLFPSLSQSSLALETTLKVAAHLHSNNQ